ncbi:MAG: Flp family type IVb pilin [Rhizobiaceae bacterium]|nr:Flp family type IVb pilin [Rhizobiaceae bacterium]
MRTVRRFFNDRTGSTVIEYGLIAALISVALISGVGAFGQSLGGLFNKAAASMDAAGGTNSTAP